MNIKKRFGARELSCRRRAQVAVLIFTFLLAALPGSALAQFYQFSNVANNAGQIDSFGGPPAMGRFGGVSFHCTLDGGGEAVFWGDVSAGARMLVNTDGPFASFGSTASGDRHVFTATLDPGQSATRGIFSASVGTVPNLGVYTIVDDSGPFASFGRVSVTRPAFGASNRAAVAFHATLDAGGSGIFYTGHGPAFSPVQTIASTAGGIFSSFGSPSVNNNSSAAFVGFRTAAAGGGSGVFIGTSAGMITTVADTAGTFSSFGSEVSFNDNGQVAFRASLDAGGEGVFLGNGSSGLATIADSAGLFESFTAVALDITGRVVFRAVLDDGTFGLYSGPNPALNKIIAFGDSLFGSTVTALDISSEGLADQDHTGFYYELADGRKGIAIVRAFIPEPGSWILLMVGAIGLTFGHMRKGLRSVQRSG